jgi:hypothetical protein
MGGAAIGLAAGILLSWTAEAALPPVHPYSLRNIPLGITLTQFRRTPHPDAAARTTPAEVVCSGDDGSSRIEGLTLTTTLLQADTKKCGYYSKAPSTGEQFVGVPVAFLGETVSPLFLFYRPEGAADYALAQITFGISNRRGSEVIGLFYRAYGSSASLDVTSVSTTFGTEMSNIRYVWKNDLSSLQLDSLSFVLDQMSVVFAESRLWSDLSDRMTTIDRVGRIASQEEKRQREAAERAAEALKSSDVPVLPVPDDGAGGDAQPATAAPSGVASTRTSPTSGSQPASSASATSAKGASPAQSSPTGSSPAPPPASALPPGSPLAGFLKPSPAPPPPSPLAGALPPGSPLAGFLPAGPPAGAPPPR